jgi:hypothetical protein
MLIVGCSARVAATNAGLPEGWKAAFSGYELDESQFPGWVRMRKCAGAFDIAHLWPTMVLRFNRGKLTTPAPADRGPAVGRLHVLAFPDLVISETALVLLPYLAGHPRGPASAGTPASTASDPALAQKHLSSRPTCNYSFIPKETLVSKIWPLQ